MTDDHGALRQMSRDDLLLHMHEQGINPRKDPPACPKKTCTGRLGGGCTTSTGFPVPFHKPRLLLILGVTEVEKPTNSKAGRWPSHAQADILEAACRNGGLITIDGYRFSGAVQRDAAIRACADPTRGWMRSHGFKSDGELFEVTNEGRNALARYNTWMGRDAK